MKARWIEHNTTERRIRRGKGEPPAAAPGASLHLVTATGSIAIHRGRLYVDGQPAGPGRYEVETDTGLLVITVDKLGRVRRQFQGGDAGGQQGS